MGVFRYIDDMDTWVWKYMEKKSDINQNQINIIPGFLLRIHFRIIESKLRLYFTIKNPIDLPLVFIQPEIFLSCKIYDNLFTEFKLLSNERKPAFIINQNENYVYGPTLTKPDYNPYAYSYLAMSSNAFDIKPINLDNNQMLVGLKWYSNVVSENMNTYIETLTKSYFDYFDSIGNGRFLYLSEYDGQVIIYDKEDSENFNIKFV